MARYVWKGSGEAHTGGWGTSTDWSPKGIPGEGDIAIINVGVASEDADESLLLPDNAINPGVEIATLSVGTGGALDIGDAAGTNFAIMTLDGTPANYVLGELVIYAGGKSGSQLRASGTIATSKQGTAKTGVIDIDGGELLALGTLKIVGDGTVALDDGEIAASSADATDRFTNYATIVGTGEIDAANNYAAPPAVPFSGKLNYHGLVTYNYGTIDANDPDSGTNLLELVGGVMNNYGTLEATDSVAGSAGAAVLDLIFGVVVNNGADEGISAGAGASVKMDRATINDGTLSGNFDAVGVHNTIEAKASSSSLTNLGEIRVYGDLTIGGGDGLVTNKGTVDVTNTGDLTMNGVDREVDNEKAVVVNDNGLLTMTGEINNGLNAVIESINGGLVIGAKGGNLTSSGKLVANGGAMVFDDAVVAGAGNAWIEGGGLMQFDDSVDTIVHFNHNGTLVFDNLGFTGNIDGFNIETGKLGHDGDLMIFKNVAFDSSLNVTFEQKSPINALLEVNAYTLLMVGNYAAVGAVDHIVTNGVLVNPHPFTAFANGSEGTTISVPA